MVDEKRYVLYECPECGRHWTLAEGKRLPDHSMLAGQCTYRGQGGRCSFTLAEATATVRVPVLVANTPEAEAALARLETNHRRLYGGG